MAHLLELSGMPKQAVTTGLWPIDACEGQTIISLFRQQVALQPQKIVLVDHHNQGLSFWQLDFLSSLLALKLLPLRSVALQRLSQAALRVAFETPVETPLLALVFTRSSEMVVAMLAAQKAGFAYIPIDPNCPASRAGQMLSETACSLLLCDRCSVSTSTSFVVGLRVQLIVVDNTCLLANDPLLCAAGDMNRGWSSHSNAIISCCCPTAGTSVSLALDGSIDLSHPFNILYVLYTSGSTGIPKGVALSTRSVLSCLQHSAGRLGTGEPDAVILQSTPYIFDLSAVELYSPLIHGSLLKMAAPEPICDPNALKSLLENSPQPTWIQMTPTVLALHVGTSVLSCSHRVRHLVVCGEVLRQDVAEAAFKQLSMADPTKPIFIHNAWGPTETAIYGSAKTFSSQSQITQHRSLSIGTPLGNRALWIFQADTDRLASLGEAGELCVSGPGVAAGYLNRTDQNAKSFISFNPALLFSLDTGLSSAPPHETLYRTGDLARWRNGELEFLGRKDSQVKIRGQRVELGEVEAVIAGYNIGVVCECAVAVQESPHGAILVAYVTPAHLSVSDLQYGPLPLSMIPSVVVTLQELPKTASGKLDRQLLVKRQDLPPRRSGLSGSTVTTPIQAVVLSVIREVLNEPTLNVSDNYFEWGATSMAAVHIRLGIQRELAVVIPSDWVFHHPSALALCQALESQPIEGCKSSILSNCSTIAISLHVITTEEQRSGSPPNLFLFHPAGGVTYVLFKLAAEIARQAEQQDRQLNIYALQDPTLKDASLPSFRSISEMSLAYWQAIRAIQPSGPYYLGGHSMGGLVATQVAALVQAAGHTVGALFLIDSFFSDHSGSRLSCIFEAITSGMAKDYLKLKLHSNRQTPLSSRFWKPISRKDRRPLASCSGPTDPSPTDVYTLRIVRLVKKHLAILKQHGCPLESGSVANPQPSLILQTKIVLFTTDGEHIHSADTLAWSKLAVEFELISIADATHTGILSGRFAPILASHFVSTLFNR